MSGHLQPSSTPTSHPTHNVNAPYNTFNNVVGDQINYHHHNQIGAIIKGLSSILFLLNVFDSVLEQLLEPAIEASYNRGGTVARCERGTREQVIAGIIEWVNDNDGPLIYWLSGPAGSGKSTISQTVAELLAPLKQLAGSFFFFRETGRRSKIAHLVPTLAYQLSRSLPETKPLIHGALKEEPLITSLSMAYQFNKLIVEPVVSVTPPQQMIFVLDGLDECDDRTSMAEFIEVMLQMIPGPPLKVFCTSRIEEHIRGPLGSPAADSKTHHINLEDFNASSDIRTFLQSRFSVICGRNRRFMQKVPQPWPSPADLEALVKKCEGSFIFAVTLFKFINDGTDFPHRKMEAALSMANGLDHLYAQVLSSASRDRHFERVVGAIMVLTRPLAITSLGQLLLLGTDEILGPLLGMQSILTIPGDDDRPIRLLHTSLRDFLTTESRSEAYFINPPVHHLTIAMDCLRVMTAHAETGIFRSKMQQYACVHWDSHLEQGLGSGNGSVLNSNSVNDLLRCLVDFLNSQGCNSWINTQPILNPEADTVDGIRSALRKASVTIVSCGAQIPIKYPDESSCIIL
jgi:hypothetical protein